MDTKYQIFVSSTYVDLQEERRGVIEQILNLRHIPIGMELFQAGDETQWNYIKRRILESDYYVLIVAERYGSEGPAGKSYTQMEYEFAIKNKVPTVAFLLHSDARKSWPQDRTEFENKDKINSFRRLCEKKLVRHWKNSDDLNAKVVTSLVELIREKPQTGWVRADSVASNTALSEIAKLSEEKRILQEKLEGYLKQEELRISPEIRHHIEQLYNIEITYYVKSDESTSSKADLPVVSYLEIFDLLKPHLSLGNTTWSLTHILKETLSLPDSVGISINDILSEFIYRGLLKFEHVQTQTFDRLGSEKRFSITDKGSQLLIFYDIERSKYSRNTETSIS